MAALNLYHWRATLTCCVLCCELRERAFLILGTRAKDFWQGGMKLFPLLCGGKKLLRATFMGVQKLFCLKKLWMKSSIKD